MYETQLHVFHYTGYSAVWIVHISPVTGHGVQPTRDANYITREYRVLSTRAEADAYVGDAVERDQQDVTSAPVTVLQHTPTPDKFAVRIQAKDPEKSRTLSGWLIYGRDGKHQRVINEHYDGEAALEKAGVTVVLSEPITLTVAEFINLECPF